MIAALSALFAALAKVVDAMVEGGGVDLVLDNFRARRRRNAAEAVAAREIAFREALANGREAVVMAEFDRLDRDLDLVGVRAEAVADGRDSRATDDSSLVD